MNFFEYFTRKKNTSASIAKERLQIIVAHERKTTRQHNTSLHDLWLFCYDPCQFGEGAVAGDSGELG